MALRAANLATPSGLGLCERDSRNPRQHSQPTCCGSARTSGSRLLLVNPSKPTRSDGTAFFAAAAVRVSCSSNPSPSNAKRRDTPAPVRDSVSSHRPGMQSNKPSSKRSTPIQQSPATCQAVSSARPAREEQEKDVDLVSFDGRQLNCQQVNGRQPNGASAEPAKGKSNGIGAVASGLAFELNEARRTAGEATSKSHGTVMDGSNGWEASGYEGNGMRQRLRVAVDVDEVLGSFLSTLNLFCAEKYSIRHDLHEFYVYDFMKVWKCSQEEANHRVHDFFKSDHFNDGIPIIPGAFETLRRLSHFTDLVVVTSRQHVIREPTLEWLDNHFPGVFSSVHFGNHFALEGSSKPKSEMCRELGAEVLIDDNPRYAVECAEHGVNVLLFDWLLQYPWSKTEGGGPHHELITRVRDWREVELAVHQLAVDRAMPWVREGRR